MNCSDCGFWNPPDQRVCGRCGLDLPAPIPLGEAADDPAPAAARPGRPKVKSEVLELFDPSKQRDRKAPAGTRLIRRRRPNGDDDGEERPDAVPGETAGRDDAPPLPPPEPKRRKRTSRRLTVCTVCTAPFPARELVKLRNKLYCLACLERRENLFDPDELQEAKRDRAARMAAAREREEEAAEANPVRRRGTDTKRLAVQARQAELASRGEGPSASHTAIIWPKCPRHPGHSTNDRCTKCRAPVCALCISRKGARTLCPGCSTPGAGPSQSNRNAGTDSSGLDMLKDVLLSPLIFFRTVPGASGAVRPFLMAMLGCFAGSFVVVVQAGMWYAADDQLGPLSLVLNRPVPVVSGAACVALSCVVLPILLHGLLASMLGGQAKFGHSARGSMFASIPGWLGAIPVGGVALWPLFHLSASAAMLRQVHDLNWFFAALGALFALAAQVAAGIVITQYVFA
jgi:hypothetical protein